MSLKFNLYFYVRNIGNIQNGNYVWKHVILSWNEQSKIYIQYGYTVDSTRDHWNTY